MKPYLRYFIDILLLISVFNSVNHAQRKKTEYYTINTMGYTFFSGNVTGSSNFSLSSIHGIHISGNMGSDVPPILEQGIWMGGGLIIDFLKSGTVTAIVYEPRVRLGALDFYAQLGYGFGKEGLKGFAFGSGIGLSIPIQNTLAIQLDLGYGGRGGEGFYFVRGGIRF